MKVDSSQDPLAYLPRIRLHSTARGKCQLNFGSEVEHQGRHLLVRHRIRCGLMRGEAEVLYSHSSADLVR
jgi:hypothetical protein